MWTTDRFEILASRMLAAEGMALMARRIDKAIAIRAAWRRWYAARCPADVRVKMMGN